ncbi:MAG: family 10 glycosylhydrolase [Cyanobacteria bacterium J06635_15]
MHLKKFLILLLVGLLGSIVLCNVSLTVVNTSFNPQALSANSLANNELRGVWLTNVDSNVLFSRENLESSIAKLSRLNFNTLYPTVWNRGYTLYPSHVAKETIGVQQRLFNALRIPNDSHALESTQGDRNMLQEVIEIAHPLHQKVVPWFEYGFKAIAETELIRLHPDWLTSRQDGGNTYTVTDNNHKLVWLNPFHPDVQTFFLALIDELVRDYEIDGIQFDDRFALPVDFGYDAYTVDLYQQEHSGQLPPTDCHDLDWVDWRADKLTAFMGEVVDHIKAGRPDAIVSIAVNPYQFAYQNFLQDWHNWVNKGFVDELVIQLYRSNLDQFVQEMEREINQLNHTPMPINIGILSGVRDRPIPMAIIREQVKTVRAHNLGGFSFFFYESLWQSDTETSAQRYESLRTLLDEPTTQHDITAYR